MARIVPIDDEEALRTAMGEILAAAPGTLLEVADQGRGMSAEQIREVGAF